MRFIEAALVLGASVALCGGAIRSLRMLWASRQPWEIQESSDDNALYVWAIKPGTNQKNLLGSASWSDPEFDYNIEKVRAEALIKLIAANSGKAKTLTR